MDETTRSYELKFEERPEYLYASVKASKLTGETARAYLRDIVDEAARRGYKRLMVERDIPVSLDMATLFFAAMDFTEMIHGMRVVFVNPHPELEDHMDFARTVATNRGANYTIVRDVESAEKWLLS